MPRRPTPLPAQLTQGSFSVHHADALGVSRKRTRAGDLVRVSRGIRIPAHPDPGPIAALLAYCELDPRATLVDFSAARVWEFPLPWRVLGDWRIRIAHPRGVNRPRRANVVGRELTFAPGEIVGHEGLRLTSPARTFLDLAEYLDIGELVPIADRLICAHPDEHPYPRSAWVPLSELRAVVRRHPGKRGVRKARLALDLARVGADSPPESRLRLAILDAGLPEPELNSPIRDSTGRPVAWPDLCYPAWRLSIQYDGAVHDAVDQYARDIERQRRTQAAGWTEVRLKKGDLDGERPRAVVVIRNALWAAGWRR